MADEEKKVEGATAPASGNATGATAPAGGDTATVGTAAPKETAATGPKETAATGPKKPKQEKKEMIEVDKNVLEQVLQKQEDQDVEIKVLKGKNIRLEAVADKSRLGWYDEQKGGGALIHTFRVAVFLDYNDLDKEGNAKRKIVLAWKMVKDEVRLENGVLKENQIYRLYLDEGEGEKASEIDIDIRQFAREILRQKGELIKEAKTNEGSTKTLRFEDGREIEFDVRFLNP